MWVPIVRYWCCICSGLLPSFLLYVYEHHTQAVKLPHFPAHLRLSHPMELRTLSESVLSVNPLLSIVAIADSILEKFSKEYVTACGTEFLKEQLEEDELHQVLNRDGPRDYQLRFRPVSCKGSLRSCVSSKISS